MSRRVLVAVMAVVLALCGLVGCGQQQGTSAADGQTVTFTDDLGNEVTVRKAPERVVACMGSFANIWQLAGGTLVGAAEESFADYDIDANSVASVGGFSTIDLEAVLALDPDFVICTGATAGHAGTDQTALADGLSASGVPLAYFKVATFDDYLRMLKTCTEITGDEAAYEKHGADQRAKIDAAIAKYAKGAAGKKVALLITYSGGARVQDSTTQTGAMLKDLGYSNIADDNQGLLSDFSTEALLEIDPDYVLVIPMGNNAEEAQKALEALTGNDAWKSLTAVAEGRFLSLDPSLFVNKPNARWAEAYETLGALLAG